MTSKLNFYAWHAFDYRADTAHLSRAADYAYRRILDEIFITAQASCQIVDDDAYLRALCRATSAEWAEIRNALIDGGRALLSKRDGHIYSPRLEAEIRKAQKKAETYRSNAKGHPPQGNPPANAEPSSSNGLAVVPQSKSKKNPSGSKSKKKNGSPTGDPGRGAGIRQALRSLGIDVNRRKSAAPLVEKWAESPGDAVVIRLIEENRDQIAAADRPLQYLGAIVRNHKPQLVAVEDPPPDRMTLRDFIRITRDQATLARMGKLKWSQPFTLDEWDAYEEHLAAVGGVVCAELEDFDEWLIRKRERGAA